MTKTQQDLRRARYLARLARQIADAHMRDPSVRSAHGDTIEQAVRAACVLYGGDQ